jgi:hypothetical protein
MRAPVTVSRTGARAVLLAIALIAVVVASQHDRDARALTGFTPIMDLGLGTYLGFPGGLYESGVNTPPADHAADGAAHVAAVQPLDTSGNPSASGKVVLLSIGMSNTTQEFCSGNSALPCSAWSFMGQAAVDPRVNHTSLAIVNGAAGGQTASTWDQPTDTNYDRVRDTRLTPQGLTEAQVQAAWVKVANAGPTMSLPLASSDAYTLETQMGNVARALRVRYPNIQLVFFSSRIYAGYATTTLNPEPYAYESGFAVKWIVQAQIDQQRNGGVIVDTRGGDLDYDVAPWLAWGPYLWADGTTARSDGLVWLQSDLAADGTHPSPSGQEKVADMLLAFFRSSPYATPWFCANPDCSPAGDAVGGLASAPEVVGAGGSASSSAWLLAGAATSVLAALVPLAARAKPVR